MIAADRLTPTVRHTGNGYAVSVPAGQAEPAAASVAAYRSENPGDPKPHEPDPPSEPSGAGLGAATLLLGFSGWLARRSDAQVWAERGAANAAEILGGEFWRCITALTLHADLGHLLGNALIGAFFVNAVGRAFGWGVGCALVVLAGGLGNALNAAMYGAHQSIGASTSVFGAVGILSGQAFQHRGHRGERGRRRWLVPVAAGLGLLAMLGTAGERVDLWAHLYGFAAGLGLGAAAARPSQPRAGLALQWGAGLATVALIAACWALALR